MIDKLSPADAKWVAQAREDFIQRVDGKEIAALRARVAKLEAALIESRKLGMKIYHNANAHEAVKDWATVKAMMDAALERPNDRG